MIWTQVKVNCAVSDLENVSAIMSMLENSVQIEDYSDIDTDLLTVYGKLIDEKLLNADKTRGACSIYVSEERNLSEYIQFIRARLEDSRIDADIETIGTDEEEWATAWKKYYKTTPIGNSVVIVPSWEHYDKKPGETVIDMDPGMAFGTGTHETTRLCASLLEQNLQKGDYMLDVGSGSGILAIIASRLGAGYCLGSDIDSVAVRTEKENACRNGCDNTDFVQSDLLKGITVKDGHKFDIVTANIVADIIIRMAPDIGGFMRDGGLLIVSGIITQRRSEVDNVLKSHGFAEVETSYDKDWCAGLYRKIG